MSEQLLTLRMNLLGGMNEFVKTAIPSEFYIASEFYINLWQDKCISADATEEDLKMIASDNETFIDCVHTFDFICLKCL